MKTINLLSEDSTSGMRGRFEYGDIQFMLTERVLGAQRGPIRRWSTSHGVLARNDISPGCQGNQRRLNIVCGILAGQCSRDVLVRVAAVEKRQEIAMDLSAQQSVKGFGNQKYLPVVYPAKFQMRRQRRHLDEARVGWGDLLQYSAPRVLARRRFVGSVIPRTCRSRTW